MPLTFCAWSRLPGHSRQLLSDGSHLSGDGRIRVLEHVDVPLVGNPQWYKTIAPAASEALQTSLVPSGITSREPSCL